MAGSRSLVRPFLKWPGGKFRLIAKIHRHLPKHPVYIEPFAGSAALFLNTQFDKAYINDLNPDLYYLYKQLQDEPKDLLRKLHYLFREKNNSEATFYGLRDKFNAASCKLERSALFVYLNRHGYNGLCRYNSKGYFNVPFGRYKRPYLPIVELEHFILCAKKAKFTCVDYATCLQRAPNEATVYCDPPYIPLTATANFTGYTKEGFDLSAHERLVETAVQQAEKGQRILISNHDTALTRALYTGAKISRFKVQRHIAVKAESRKKAPELLALFQKQ